MITLNNAEKDGCMILFAGMRDSLGVEDRVFRYISREYQAQSLVSLPDGSAILYIGLGDGQPGIRQVKEAAAGAARKMKQLGIQEYTVDMTNLMTGVGIKAVRSAVEGIYEGIYEIVLPKSKGAELPEIFLKGIPKEKEAEAQRLLEEGIRIGEAQTWARTMVNAPGNLFHPMDFAREIMEKMQNTSVECELLVYSKLNAIGMHALTSVGKSSENPPCMLVMRYRGGNPEDPITGLVGKGVTCDTGGYCLKPAGSMLGIKGDMAGGAAVAGAIYALAQSGACANVTGIIPMCENRISPSSLVPGDVIGSYGGKKIEICNTDAEGRLILADAAAYLVKDEKVDKVIDIATLTGAVVNMFGFSTAGSISNDDAFYGELEEAALASGERYWRLPVFEEQKKMIRSEIADIKNMGKDYCGTITAGLFIQAFTDDKPWIHLDIAGTAWVDTPLFDGQPCGATGAGVSTLYYMFEKRR